MHAGFWLCEHKSLQTPGSAVFWWLIWVWDHIILPQQKQKGAKMNRSWPLNLPDVEKECATRSLNSFVSFCCFPFSCRINWMRLKGATATNFAQAGFWYSCWWFYVWYKTRTARRSPDRCGGLCVWKTGRLRIMTLITRRLTSVTSSLSSFHSLFLPWHVLPHALSYALFLLPHCPRFQSIVATYLSHHSNCSLQRSPFLSDMGEWKGWDGWEWGRGRGRRRGRFVRFGGLMRCERCCFGSRNLSCNMHPIDPLKRLPIQQKRQDDSSPSANWGEESLMWWKFENSQISPAAIIRLVLSIFIHFPLIFVNVSHAASPTTIIIITIYTSVTQTHQHLRSSGTAAA